MIVDVCNGLLESIERCVMIQVSKLDSAIAKLSPEFTNEELDLFKKLVGTIIIIITIHIECTNSSKLESEALL